ncbi:MAG: heat-inducible transcription repressor HrcA [Micrococcales bacterium]|nr:heat-inducible transcription repressor HrcA [Micrococcales bacterium]NBR54475.1 heat-inducible transcription repressor HrcA [Micrococcales bacterium]NBR62097.1 heat-inducible transcription repressor HrcA [Actinomycetota bacterium]NBY43714.1 heat-inducible transcription repressor HrcA [Micrococcales bacterium]
MISERGMAVLRAIIEDFIATNEPVASKSLVDRHNFGVSSATIRNDMAYLEEEGYIVAPHTSAGRIPTDKGYRVFVDQLIQAEAVTAEIKKNLAELNRLFAKTLDQLTDLDEKLQTSAQLLAKATGEAAVVQYPNLKSIAVSSIELVKVAENRVLILLITNADRIQQHVVILKEDWSSEQLVIVKEKINAELAGQPIESLSAKLNELAENFDVSLRENIEILVSGLSLLIDANKQEKIAFAGTANLVRNEQQFAGNLATLLNSFDEHSEVWQVLNSWQLDSARPRAIIGSEHSVHELSNSSLLISSYSSQGTEVAKVAVVGPTRMNYPKNFAAVLALAKLLSKDDED